MDGPGVTAFLEVADGVVARDAGAGAGGRAGPVGGKGRVGPDPVLQYSCTGLLLVTRLCTKMFRKKKEKERLTDLGSVAWLAPPRLPVDRTLPCLDAPDLFERFDLADAEDLIEVIEFCLAGA